MTGKKACTVLAASSGALILAGVTTLWASKDLEGVACRSVHLGYPAPEGTAFYNEVAVDRSAPGSYFMVCGFSKGYFGIQELGNGGKVVLFSVWDPGSQNNPNIVAEERRVRVPYQDTAVRVKRFGGEGTGGQCFYDYTWQTGQVYRFCVTAAVHGERTEFAAYFFEPERKAWRHLVTFDTLAGGKALGGYYSFVEDFRRNRVSATQVRRARYGNGWVRDANGAWHELTRARFTGDGNPVMNIDAGVDRGMFFLATGGGTANTHTPLWKSMDRPTVGVKAPSLPLPEGIGRSEGNR